MVTHKPSPDDETFRSAFEACTFPARAFDHRAHVRLAYLYLCAYAPDEACEFMKRSLLAFLQHLGVGEAKYHETVTRAWVLAVHHFMVQTPACSSAEAFIERNPVLLGTDIMLTHYSAEVLFSAEARERFVAPDVEAIPEH